MKINNYVQYQEANAKVQPVMLQETNIFSFLEFCIVKTYGDFSKSRLEVWTINTVPIIVKFPEVFSIHSASAPAFPAKNIPAIEKNQLSKTHMCSFYSSPFMMVPVIFYQLNS